MVTQKDRESSQPAKKQVPEKNAGAFDWAMFGFILCFWWTWLISFGFKIARRFFMSGRRYRAALMFTVMSLAGCSLVEQVIVIEHRKESVKSFGTPSKGVARASGEFKCAQTGAGGPGCPGKVHSARHDSGGVISKSYSARYDIVPVLKPVKKTPENKPAEVREGSAFVSAVKSWIRTGMQLPGWAGRK